MVVFGSCGFRPKQVVKDIQHATTNQESEPARGRAYNMEIIGGKIRVWLFISGG